MGLRVLVADMKPDSTGFALADDYTVTSTRDVSGLKAFANDYQRRGHRIDGVLVMGSDIPQVVCELAEHLGTPHIPMEAALLSTHKYQMKSRFQEYGIPIPWFTMVSSVVELQEIIREHGYPLIIKPVDRSGARGVFFLEEGCDTQRLFYDAQQLSFCGEVMVEEYLPGLQISTESIMYQGTAYTPGFDDRNYEKLRDFAPNIIENGGTMPSCVSIEHRFAVERLVELAGRALGVVNGVIKGDVVMTPDGPKLIEVATRLSGGDFSESIIPLGCGVNIVEAAISIALGRKPDLEKLRPKYEKGVANRYFFPAPGRLVSIEGVDEVLSLPWVHKLEFWYKIGDTVPVVTCHADRFGVVVISGKTREEVESRVDQVYRTIRILTEPV
ncbi:MAG: ATP-grasp domain-containing protein [Deltaproteobacteria bacterium]|nr:ATP-grasp domain-containing protein [Deltaproteobacteria bacterium]